MDVPSHFLHTDWPNRPLEERESFEKLLSGLGWAYKEEVKLLTEIAESLLPFYGVMPMPNIAVVENSTIKDTIAYCQENIIVFIRSKVDFSDYNETVDTMKHEMIHAWMHYNRMDKDDSKNHGSLFQKKAKEIGLTEPY